jgi:hypothetical protein
MDEALKKIERLLAEDAPKSRLEPMLPKQAAAPVPTEEMAITHLSKGAAVKAEAASAPASAPVQDLAPAREPAPSEDDLYKKISAGGREFSLDELGGSGSGTEVVDPLMGPMLKPGSSYRDVSLDELDVNITPEGPQPKQ